MERCSRPVEAKTLPSLLPLPKTGMSCGFAEKIAAMLNIKEIELFEEFHTYRNWSNQ
jgi:hypothetical protein